MFVCSVKPLIIANWKCNPVTLREAKLLFNSVNRGLKDIKKIDAVICPPFLYLPEMQIRDHNLKLGGQNCFWEEKGAFTGEVSPLMLKDLKCEYVIIGHSERRRYFKEKYEMINKKLKAVFNARLSPILCVGETKKEREQGKTREVLKKQLQEALNNLNIQPLHSLIVAYEPIWAIGTGKACSPFEAKKATFFIRSTVSKIYNRKIAQNTMILYGGSVTSENAKAYLSEAGFQGLLIGGASLNAKEFIKIAKIAGEA